MKLKTVKSGTRKFEQGQTIIELMIAILVVGVVVISVAVGLTFSVINTSEVRYRESATSLSQDGLEFFRNERARLGWQTFSANIGSGIYCLDSMPVDIYAMPGVGACTTTQTVSLPPGAFNPGFLREATVTNTGSQVNVSVETKWLKSDGSYRNVTLQQNLKDWN